MLEQVPQKYDQLSIEREIEKFWNSEDMLHKVLDKNKGNQKFSFLEGPPTANGPPHIGHAETRAIKDLVLRYKSMRGYYIFPRRAGWDCHGLPVEIEVEKTLGIKSKKEIEEFGVEKFNKLCKESVFKYVKEWESVSKRLGFWVDYEHAYVTMNDEYIESEWWALKKLYENGLLFKDFRISPYCPRCGTTLSAHEVAQGYKDIEDYSIYVLFKLKNKEEYFLVWTTTPWTLPANTFLAVNPQFDYVLINLEGKKFWLLEERAPAIIKGKEYEVLDKKKGSEFRNWEYEQLLPYLKIKKGLYVVTADFVSKEDGSGIVHIAPAFGSDDYNILKKENGELYVTVAEDGKINLESPWKGMDVNEANEKIIEFLKKEGKLFKREKIVHSYPHCWRCGTKLIYYPVESWYIGVSKKKDLIVNLNKKINWKPEYIRDGRFGNFLEEGKDWALSRNRFWGTPLPVWTCQNGHIFIPGSKKELLDRAIEIPPNFELHKPYVDNIKVKCDKCGEFMKREPYPIDTWFDSGSAFYAQYHYPFEGQDLFKENYPIDFISEAIDQTRGWFYSLHVISSLLFENISFKNVVVMEFILNSKGEKMSKSKGDVVDPKVIMDQIGADSLRLFFFQGPPWKPKRFSNEIAQEYSRKLLGTLYNSYVLISTNANLDKWVPKEEKIINYLDRWMESRTNQALINYIKYMDDYEPHRGLEEIEKLVDEFSQWYLRLSRDRFWKETVDEDKRSAYFVAYRTLEVISKMLAPFAPYFSEYLYKKLTGKYSVHMDLLPEPGEEKYDEILVKEMRDVRNIVEISRRIRQLNGISLRRPVREVVVGDKSLEPLVNKYKDLLLKELNAKEVKVEDPAKYKERTYKLDRKKVGKIFGKDLQEAEREILDPEMQAELDRKGEAVILDKTVTKSDAIVEENVKEGYISDLSLNIPIFISSEFDRDLYLEGLAREIIRRIQSMRKDLNLDYTDKIFLDIQGDKDLLEAYKNYKNSIEESTLSKFKDNLNGYTKEWEIDELKLKITIAKME